LSQAYEIVEDLSLKKEAEKIKTKKGEIK